MGDMTGDAPQPGETPRNEGNPWSYADPESAWWRGETDQPQPARRRPTPGPGPAPGPSSAPGPGSAPTVEPPTPTQHTGEAAAAHDAGAQDVTAALTGETPAGATAVFQAPKAVDHHHDQVDDERFNTAGTSTEYVARAAGTEPQETQPVPQVAQPVPEVMILPEPERNRPTVALERGAVPGQPPSGRSRQGQTPQERTPEGPARADRALQDRVRQERTSALLETSPFWQGEERRAGDATPPQTPERPATTGVPPRRKPRLPRRPAAGLVGLLALGLVAAFFAWVSAEPFWLAVGHGDQGSATVGRCTGDGVTQRCAGQFTVADGAYRVDDLALLGVEPAQRTAGAVARARMVSSDSRQAYVGGTGLLVHLRWALGFVLVLLCGLGIAGLTGARRLETTRARRGALLISLAGPLALLAGFLLAAY